MTNKLVISRLGNDQYRFFAFNTPILVGEYFSLDKYNLNEDKAKEDLIAFEIYEQIQNINLVVDVSIRKYEVSVGIADGFEHDTEEWTRIINEVERILSLVVFGYGVKYTKTERDLSKEYKSASLHDLDLD